MTAGAARHLTTREVWPALIAVTVVGGVTAAVCVALTSRGSLSGWWVPVASIAPALVTVLLVRTLAGNDVTLEQSLPRAHGAFYALHALGLVAVNALVAAAVGPTFLHGDSGSAMLRNSLGLAGLALASAAVLRPAATWIPVVAYTLFILMAAPREPGRAAVWWAWPAQPGTNVASWIAATALLLAGSISYVRRGPKA